MKQSVRVLDSRLNNQNRVLRPAGSAGSVEVITCLLKSGLTTDRMLIWNGPLHGGAQWIGKISANYNCELRMRE